MTMPDCIKITHAQPMTTPTISAALDTFEQTANRGTWFYFSPELVRELRAALKVEPQSKGPTDKDLYDLAAEFNGDPVPAMRQALELWGNPPAPGPGEVGEVAQWLLSMRELAGEHNPEERRQFTRAATLLQQLSAPAPGPKSDIDHVEQLAATIRTVDGNHSMGAAALAEAILERYPLAFSVDPLDTPPAPEVGEVGELVELLKMAGRWATSTGVHLDRFAALFDQQAAELAALRDAPHPTYLDAIRLAQGCHDYSGGHSGTEGKAWHRAIDMVVGVLKRAEVGPWDSQTRAVFGVGVEAQAGEVEA